MACLKDSTNQIFKPIAILFNLKMKAIQILGPKNHSSVTVNNDIPKPTLSGTDVLIRVCGAGITADEIGWPELYESPTRIPGHDISGVIEDLGPNYTGSLSVGDEVFAMLQAESVRGGQAEYTVATIDEVALKPKTIGHSAAAALPIPALTAWEGLFQHASLKNEDTILVTGASGAVGSIVVQLASKLLGAKVVCLASSSRHEYLKKLGATQCIDYHDESWSEVVQNVSMVFDTVGGDTLAKCWKTVKQDGTIVTIGDPIPAWAFGQGKPIETEQYPNVKWAYFIVSSNGEQLGKIASLIDDKTLEPLLIESYNIDNGVEAWGRAAQRGRLGKVVIEM